MNKTFASDIDTLCINTIRTLAMDAVQAANSGHPGAPMAMAPVVYTLYDRFMRHDPAHPDWENRDRFVLSMGHASMLLYSILHLTGYDISLKDIKNFRQLHGKCAGHPEFGLAGGIETTTGPLGQGVATSVGMAIAGKWKAERFNGLGRELIDYRTFALCSDGDMMEGVSSEAASLAGHLGLDNLVWLYDDNRITIDGSTDLSFGEDVGSRFKAYGWHVQRVEDANDLNALSGAITTAIDQPDKPALIVVRSHIAYGSPNKQDTSAAHGSPLGEDEIRATKKAYGWDPDNKFFVPEDVTSHCRQQVADRGAKLFVLWQAQFEAYEREHPKDAKTWHQITGRELPEGWDSGVPVFEPDCSGLATRQSSGKALNAIAEQVPWLFGGSADLAASTKTLVGDKSNFLRDGWGGRNLNFGIREHAMGSIANGLSLCGMRPYTATFLVFSDYMRPAIRLAALMGQPVIFVFTHDSIGVGEDGPTHQPIEHVAALRSIPHLDVIRPGDATETAVAWKQAMTTTDHPVALILTRQALPTFERIASPIGDAARGAYVLSDCEGRPDVLLIGTGSEVQLCMQAQHQLGQEGMTCRVVSMPCQEAFDRQELSYRDEVLLPAVAARVAVEAGVAMGWHRYVGDHGEIVACRDFGASAPIQEVMIECGMTTDAVVQAAKRTLTSVS